MRHPFEHLKEHLKEAHGCDRGREERHFRGRGGPFNPFGEGERWGRRGGLGRLFGSGDLRYLLLDLIAEQPRHGYELIKAIEDKFGGLYSPSPGIIYPTLTMLQDMGLIVESDAAGTRKVYAATLEGTAHLAEKEDEVAALLARITELASAQKGDRAPVRRAMRNLHAALVEKIARSDNDELMHKIAALLDEVTQKIERS